MRLDPFITDLLYDHDCVVLPEFGGLVANYRPARLNVISHVIQPPSKHIGFNPSLKYNDGLLANYIASALGISYKDAAAQLADTISEFHQILSTDGRFSIDRIGVFYKDRLGQIQFIPEEQENFLVSSHGLKPLQLKLVGGLENTPNQGKVIEMNSGKTMRNWKIAAAIVVPALLVGSWMLGSKVGSHGGLSFASLNPFGETRKDSMYAPVNESWDLPMKFAENNRDYLLNDSAPVSIDFVNGVADDAGIALASPAEEPPVIAETPTSQAVTSPKRAQLKSPEDASEKLAKLNSTAAYTLIGGAFQMKENAQRLIDQLREQGYDAQLAGMKENLYLVAYGHFKSRTEAESVKKKVQAGGAKAWIRTNQ